MPDLSQMNLSAFPELDHMSERKAAEILAAMGDPGALKGMHAIFAALCREVADLRYAVKIRDGSLESNRRANLMLLRRLRYQEKEHAHDRAN